MKYPFEAVISEKSERYQEWLSVLGTNRVAVTFHETRTANVLGEEKEIYLLNLRSLSDEQRARLVSHIAIKFSVPLAEVERDIESHGVPILADDVMVLIDPRFF